MTEEEQEYQYWYDKAERILIEQATNDQMSNLMLLTYELRLQYKLGMIDGVKKYNSGER